MQQVKLESWSAFEGAIQKVSLARQDLEQRNHQDLPALLFRGLGSSEWGLETTLERPHPSEPCGGTLGLRGYYRVIEASKPAIETFSGRRWDKLPTTPEFEALMDRATAKELLSSVLSPLTEVYEYLAYLRHHGFPSPLLDWTASPYVAAFFALDAPPTQSQEVCVCVLLRGSFRTASDKADLSVVGPYMRSHPRHFLQQCWYSVCVALVNKDYVFKPHERGLSGALGQGGELFKIIIPIKERLTALKQLDLMNINEFSLFGTEDSLVRTVARRELLFRA